MYIPLVFLSLIGFCITGLFGRHIGPKGAAMLTTSCLFVSFLLSLFAFYEVGLMGSFVYVRLATWVSSEVLLSVSFRRIFCLLLGSHPVIIT